MNIFKKLNHKREALILFLIGLILVWISSCVTKQIDIQVNPSPSPTAYVADLDVSKSACALHSWSGRGKGSTEYFNQVAINYHKIYCNKTDLGPSKGPEKDALAFYGVETTTRNTYALLIGLGLRESTGRVCTSRDASASNIGSNEAEAGAFQSSYNSHIADARLVKIYEYYKANPDQCNKLQACDSKNYGEGEGVQFQRLSKNCPQFSVEYNAQLIRVLRKHYGPVNRKEVQLIPECVDMLKEVEKIPCPITGWVL